MPYFFKVLAFALPPSQQNFYFVDLEVRPSKYLPSELKIEKMRKPVVFMSIIACTEQCQHQEDGYCMLQRVSQCGRPTLQNTCVDFLPRLQDSGQRLTDVAHPNEL